MARNNKKLATQCENNALNAQDNNDQRESDAAIAQFKKCISGMGDEDLEGVKARLAAKIEAEQAKRGSERRPKILNYLGRMSAALQEQVDAYNELNLSGASSSGSSSSSNLESGSDTGSDSDSNTSSGSRSSTGSDSVSDTSSGSDSNDDNMDEDDEDRDS